MPRKVVIFCPRASAGASLLRDEIRALGVSATRLGGKAGDSFVNWGTSDRLVDDVVINRNIPVSLAQDKMRSLDVMLSCGVSVPRFSEHKEAVHSWGIRRVVCRSLLRASCGRGMEVLDRNLNLPDCPLYVEYIPKDAEFRIHVMAGQVIARQKKVKKIGTTPTMEIRSHDNGWIFARNFTDPPELQSGYLNDLAVRAVAALGLDFGAVDIIWSKRRNAAFVLEVNTAPGLEGQTAKDYAASIVRFYYNNRRVSD